MSSIPWEYCECGCHCLAVAKLRGGDYALVSYDDEHEKWFVGGVAVHVVSYAWIENILHWIDNKEIIS